MTAGVTSRVTGGVGGEAFKNLPENDDLNPPTFLDQGGPGGNGDVTRDASGDVTRDAPPGPPRVTDATDENIVSAWCAGISSATGEPCAAPLGRAAGHLADVVRAHRKCGDPVVWTRDAARAYATANRGLMLTPFNFRDWLTSGRIVRTPPALPPATATGAPTTATAAAPDMLRARERAEDEKHVRLKKTAVLAPPEFFAALNGAAKR